MLDNISADVLFRFGDTIVVKLGLMTEGTTWKITKMNSIVVSIDV